jgi:hypothetical protein
MSHPAKNPEPATTAHTEAGRPADYHRPARLSHAGEGRLVPNLVAFTIMLVLFVAAVYALSFFERTNVLPFGISLALAFLAFWIPQTIMGRSDTGGELAHGERREP